MIKDTINYLRNLGEIYYSDGLISAFRNDLKSTFLIMPLRLQTLWDYFELFGMYFSQEPCIDIQIYRNELKQRSSARRIKKLELLLK